MKIHWIIVWSAIIAVVFYSYFLKGAPEHFFKHFFIGADFGLAIALLDFFINRKRRRNWLLYPIFGWLFAMFPDILHVLGYEGHRGAWINIFLLHNFIDEIKAIEVWLGIALIAEIFIYVKFIPIPSQKP